MKKVLIVLILGLISIFLSIQFRYIFSTTEERIQISKESVLNSMNCENLYAYNHGGSTSVFAILAHDWICRKGDRFTFVSTEVMSNGHVDLLAMDYQVNEIEKLVAELNQKNGHDITIKNIRSLAMQSGFILGVWNTAGTESYEAWEKETDIRYVGYAYKIQDGKKKIWERMIMSKETDGWQYAVTVPDQNEAEAVIFKLISDPMTSGEWLFANPEHGFPKTILYKKINESEWFADVRGDENAGFSITMNKVN